MPRKRCKRTRTHMRHVSLWTSLWAAVPWAMPQLQPLQLLTQPPWQDLCSISAIFARCAVLPGRKLCLSSTYSGYTNTEKLCRQLALGISASGFVKLGCSQRSERLTANTRAVHCHHQAAPHSAVLSQPAHLYALPSCPGAFLL